ncbi:MAG: hypothetical protein HDS84_02900 [Bacteroidales bacterium]|nr:hypothetical protein [Bacteroidales bacterium]
MACHYRTFRQEMERTSVGTWRATSDRYDDVMRRCLFRRGTPRPYIRPVMGRSNIGTSRQKSGNGSTF